MVDAVELGAAAEGRGAAGPADIVHRHLGGDVHLGSSIIWAFELFGLFDYLDFLTIWPF